jgi:hypothetical protein
MKLIFIILVVGNLSFFNQFIDYSNSHSKCLISEQSNVLVIIDQYDAIVFLCFYFTRFVLLTGIITDELMSLDKYFTLRPRLPAT